MNKLVLILPLLPLAACAEAQAEPEPDPAEVERLIAGLEAAEARDKELEQKAARADRLVGLVERADPEKLAGAAERLLAR